MVLPKEHSVEVPDTKEKKATATRRSFLQPEELTDGGKESLYESFENAVRKHGGRPCLGYRPVVKKQAQEYVWQSYKEVKQRVVSAAAGLLSLGMEKGSCLGIFCKNCPEWIISDKACLMYGLISVPLYDTLGEEAVVFVIEQTEMPIIVAHSSQIELLVKHKKKLTNLQTVVLVDEVPKSGGGKDQHGGYKLLSFKDLEEEGAKVEKKKEPTPCKGDETCTIVYTSGTTGTPKGAVLTSDNFMAVQRSILKMASNGILFDVNEDDVHLSYLPLAHIFDRVITTVCLNVGARVGFYQGEPSKLSDDIATLRPTLLAGVPRVYSRIFDQILSASSHMGPVASCLFRTAVEAKKLALHQGYLHNWLFDRLIFRKVQAKFGGRIKCLLSGGAPLTPELLDFMRVVFACELHEVYGQTETTGGSCVTLTGDYEAGTVGSLLLCTEVKLEDIPDMNFSSKDKPHPRGEVCFRGPAMFKGYYKDEKNTKETIDEDGWVHTGDIGLFDERGRLKIIDRKKNLFKLAQGEYIAPDKIEDAYAESKYVKQVFVHGESDKSYLVAVVVAEEKHVTSLAEGGSFEEAAKDKKVKQAVIEDMKKAGQAKGLKSFEQVKDIHITKEPFTVDNGLLTPTMKVKRPQIKEKYKKELEGLGK